MISRFALAPNVNFDAKGMLQKVTEVANKGKQLVIDHPVATAAGTAATIGILVGKNLFRAKQ